MGSDLGLFVTDFESYQLNREAYDLVGDPDGYGSLNEAGAAMVEISRQGR